MNGLSLANYHFSHTIHPLSSCTTPTFLTPHPLAFSLRSRRSLSQTWRSLVPCQALSSLTHDGCQSSCLLEQVSHLSASHVWTVLKEAALPVVSPHCSSSEKRNSSMTTELLHQMNLLFGKEMCTVQPWSGLVYLFVHQIHSPYFCLNSIVSIRSLHANSKHHENRIRIRAWGPVVDD